MEKQKQAPGKNGRKNRASRRKKQKYYGNKATCPAESIPETSEIVDLYTEEVVSASRKKLKLDATEDTPAVSADKFIDCNIIINITLMIEFFEKLCKCPNCGEHTTIIPSSSIECLMATDYN